MQIKLNGSEISLTLELTLAQLLTEKKMDRECVVVEYNEKIVKREELATIVLKDQDEIEVLRFVGGG